MAACTVIGLMSGTSADAIDAALVEWPDDARDCASRFDLLRYRENFRFPGGTAARGSIVWPRMQERERMLELAAAPRRTG